MLLRCRIENAAMHLPKLGGTPMWTAKRFKNQAATCAVLAKKTHDEDSRQRYLRLEQMYLHLAETEEHLVSQLNVLADMSKTKREASP